MTKSTIARLLSATGILYGLMEIVGDSLSSTTDSSNTPQQIAAYFAGHAPTLSTWAGIFIETTGAFAFLIFAAYLWSLSTGRAEGRILGVLALAGGLIQTAIILTGEPPKAAAFYRAAQGLDPQVAAALRDLNNGSFTTGFLAQALLVAAASGLALRSGIFSRWLAWPGLVLAVALVVVIAATPPGSGAAIAVNLVFLLWLAVTSGTLAWRAPSLEQAWSRQPAAV